VQVNCNSFLNAFDLNCVPVYSVFVTFCMKKEKTESVILKFIQHVSLAYCCLICRCIIVLDIVVDHCLFCDTHTLWFVKV